MKQETNEMAQQKQPRRVNVPQAAQKPQDATDQPTPDTDTTQDVSTPQDGVQGADGGLPVEANVSITTNDDPVLDDDEAEKVANDNQGDTDDSADKAASILGPDTVAKLLNKQPQQKDAKPKSDWPKKVRLTINPNEEVEVTKTTYDDLKFQGLIASE